jgi:hypothetical protein
MLTTNSIEKQIFVDVINNPGDSFYESVLSDFLDEQGIDHDFRKSLHNNRITELKPYQEKCLDIWAKYWTSIDLYTKPTNEDKAEQCVYNLYIQLGFSKPKKIIWFDNPVEMWRQAINQVISLYNQVNQRYYQILNLVYDQVWGCGQLD